MSDRYDDLMFGLYRGRAPDWLPEPSRELFHRESLRRRCDLGQALVASFRCTMFSARALHSEDFAERVYSAWPDARFSAPNVVTGLYLAMDEVLRSLADSSQLQELLHYEALALADLRVRPGLPTVSAAGVRGAGLADAEVYHFSHRVTALHARILLYAGAAAPASFVRSLAIPAAPTFVSRQQAPGGWVLTDVTDHFDAMPGVLTDVATALH